MCAMIAVFALMMVQPPSKEASPQSVVARRARHGLRLLKGAGIAAMGALAAEGVAALVLPSPPVDRRPLVRSDAHPVLGYRLVPNQRAFSYQAEVRTNAAGLRSGPLDGLPAEGLRTAVLGGSETFGKGVAEPETFARRLEASAAAGRVINAGTPDYVLRQSLVWLEVEGARLLRAEDRVVLTLFWDDLFEDQTVRFPPRPSAEEGAAMEQENEPPIAVDGEWWIRTWAREKGLLEYVAPIYTRSRLLYVVRNEAKIRLGRLRNLSWVRWQDGLRSGAWSDDLAVAVERAGKDLDYFARLCRANRYRPTVLFIPSDHEIANASHPVRLRRTLAQHAQAAALPWVDPTEALRSAHQAGIGVTIPYDGVPSGDGHRVIAEVLLRSLERSP